MRRAGLSRGMGRQAVANLAQVVCPERRLGRAQIVSRDPHRSFAGQNRLKLEPLVGRCPVRRPAGIGQDHGVIGPRGAHEGATPGEPARLVGRTTAGHDPARGIPRHDHGQTCWIVLIARSRSPPRRRLRRGGSATTQAQ